MTTAKGTEISQEEHMEVKVISWTEYVRAVRAYEIRNEYREDAQNLEKTTNQSHGVRRRFAA